MYDKILFYSITIMATERTVGSNGQIYNNTNDKASLPSTWQVGVWPVTLHISISLHELQYSYPTWNNSVNIKRNIFSKKTINMKQNYAFCWLVDNGPLLYVTG